MVLSPRPLPSQGWPCREGNPLPPVCWELGKRDVEEGEPAHGGLCVLPSPHHGAERLEIAWHPIEGCGSVWPNKPFQSLHRGGSCGTAWEEWTQALHLGGHQTPHAALSP